MNYFKRIICVVIIAGICIGTYLYFWNTRVLELNLVFTSDGHGHVLPSTAYWLKDNPEIGGLPAMGSYLSSLEVPYLLVDSGDLFQGTPEGILTRGKMVGKLMDMLGYQAAAIGNHEYDMGESALEDLAGSVSFPLLGANILKRDTGKAPEYAKKYIIDNLQGIDIGVTGVITTDMESLTIRKNVEGLKFIKPEPVINSTAEVMRKEGAEIVVVLSHLGLVEEKKIASRLNNVDVILGGHSHDRLEDPERINRTLICHPGSNFINAGHLKLYYSTSEDKVISYSHRLIPLFLSKYPEREDIKEVINNMMTEVSEKMMDVIGSSKIFLSNHLAGEQRKHGELALGNWQTDLMRKTAESDFAFQNTGGIRSNVPEGKIKVRDIWELSPFGNTLVKMTLIGKQVRELLEQSAAQEYSKLQVSGLKMIYNSSLPKGRKVLNIIVEGEEGQQEIEEEKEYTIVTNSFLAQGGDGYTVFQEGMDIEETAVLLRDIEIEYIRESSPIDAEIERRLLNVSIEWSEDE